MVERVPPDRAGNSPVIQEREQQPRSTIILGVCYMNLPIGEGKKQEQLQVQYESNIAANVQFMVQRENALVIAPKVPQRAFALAQELLYNPPSRIVDEEDIRLQQRVLASYTWTQDVENGLLFPQSQHPIPVAGSFIASDVSALIWPTDVIVQGDTGFAVNPNYRNVLTDVLPLESALLSADISEGGRVVKGKSVVFFGVNTEETPPYRQQRQKEQLHDLFPDREIILLPTPKSLRLHDNNRVDYHIDEDIAPPLPLKPGNPFNYLVLSDQDYARRVYRYERRMRIELLPEIIRGERYRYQAVPKSLTGKSYALNCPTSPSNHIYIGEGLFKFLQQEQLDTQIDWSQVSVLPGELPVSPAYRGGQKCKSPILFATIKSPRNLDNQ